MAKKPVFGQNRLKWPFLAIFQQNRPVATGLKPEKNPKIGVFPKKRGKIPRSRVPRRGFYINPSRRGPAVPRGPGEPPTPRRVESLLAAPDLEGEVVVFLEYS